MTTEVSKVEELSIDKLAELAHANRLSIIESKTHTGKWFLILARLLKQNRDLSLYKMLDYDTFEEFLGDPDISFRRTTAYNLIRKYELFVEKLQLDEPVLARIGTTKLGIIAPVVEGDPGYDAEGLRQRLAGRDRPVGLDLHRELVVVRLLTDASFLDLVSHASHRAVDGVDRNDADLLNLGGVFG